MKPSRLKSLRITILAFYLLAVLALLGLHWYQAGLRSLPSDSNQDFALGVMLEIPSDLSPIRMNQAYELTQNLHLSWTKLEISWDEIEPLQGQYQWESLDFAMEKSAAYGMRPLLLLTDTPDWARESGVYLERNGPPVSNADFVNFVRAVLERYPNQIYALEIWHEQNLDREWTSARGLSARNYVELLSQTYRMVQEISPGTIVISGAIAPTGLDDGIGAIDDFRYMQQMIDNGLLDVVDCVGMQHSGYNVSPLYTYDALPNDPTASFRGPFNNPHHSWVFRSTMEGYISRIRNAGSDKKLCITEFGWPATEDLAGFPKGFEFAPDNSLSEQAQYITDALDLISASGDVWLAFVNNLNYGMETGWDTNNYRVLYALIAPDNVSRPAYDAIRNWQEKH